MEEVKLRASTCQLQNEDVYMNTTFQDFIQMCVRKLRGEDGEEELVVDYVSATCLDSQNLFFFLVWLRKDTFPTIIS